MTAAAVGSSGSLNSGSVTTTNKLDLLFAGGVSANAVTSPGAGYTTRSTSWGNMTEDKIASAIGSYGATASNSGGAWAMQMVAFKGASGTSGSQMMVPARTSVNGAKTSTDPLSQTNSKTVTLTAKASPDLVSCQSPRVAGGDSTQCRVTLSKSAPQGGDRLRVGTSSTTLQVPSTVFVPEGQTSVQFRAHANVSKKDEDVIPSAGSASDSGATSLSLREIKPSVLSCGPRYVQAGQSVMCDLQLSSAATSDSLVFSVSSSSQGLKVPAQVSTRSGQSRIRFAAIADSAATQETAVLEARLAETMVQETVAILSPGVTSLTIPDHLIVQPGSAARFIAVARDGQNLPLTVSVSGQPLNATFDATRGAFEWRPTEADLGRHSITFTATNATGVDYE